jgi:outer membrane protein assembly factor BamB
LGYFAASMEIMPATRIGSATPCPNPVSVTRIERVPAPVRRPAVLPAPIPLSSTGRVQNRGERAGDSGLACLKPARVRLLRQSLSLAVWGGLVGFAVIAHGANWPQWRGLAFNGSSEERTVPERFSRTENVAWSVEMPGASAATPVVWGDRVFLPSVDDRTQSLLALCLDLRTGAEIWRREVGVGSQRDDRSNFAAPSPVTDGERVWFYYSTGELVAYDLAGAEQWRRNIQRDYGEFAFLWTFSSSPLLYDGRLYLQVLQRDVPVSGRGRRDGPNDSYLLALDPATGGELWRQVRPSDAVAESREAFSTPIPLLGGTRPEILLMGGDCVTGHDPATGRELWRWGTWNPTRISHWRVVPSPVFGGGVVLACAPKNEPVFAVKAGGSGVLDDRSIAWKSATRDISSDVPTPLYYEGRFYVLNGQRKSISSVDPATGKVFWTGQLDSRVPFESSPTAAGGRVFAVDHRGRVFVAATRGDEFQLVHQVDMGDERDRRVRSSVVITQGRLLIRTDTRLFCIGARW